MSVKKKILSALLSICLLLPVGMNAVPASAAEITADTTWYNKEDVKTSYTLTSAAQLAGLIDLVNDKVDFERVTIELGNDIVVNDTTNSDWISSAQEWIDGKRRTSFDGIFDGKGHKIIGLYSDNGLFSEVGGTIQNVILDQAVITNSSSSESVGALVNSLDSDASIKNCTVTNSSISSTGFNTNTGGIVGNSQKGSVENCQLTNSTVAGGSSCITGGISGLGGTISASTVSADCEINGETSIGGITGSATGVITNCSNAASVSGNGALGGIAGGVASSGASVNITDCENSGAITGSENAENVGGILGTAADHGITVSNCTNIGNVSGHDYVGGIAGRLSSSCTVSNSTSEGAVSGTSNVGGIAGISDVDKNSDQGNPNTIENCTVSAKVSGTSNVGGLLGSNSVSKDATKEATSIKNNVLMPTASVNGTEKTGALIGDNSEMTKDSGTIINNVWSENLGSASGSGIGDALTSADSAVAKQNSSYGSDGKLNNPLPTGEGGSTINSLSDALTQLIAGGDESKVPETLKVTVTYQNNGHGAAVTGQTIVIGDEITLPAMENDGYFTFLGWSDGTTTYAAGTTVGIMKDTTFTAQWRDDTPPYTGKYSYEVFTSVGDNGTISVDRYATEGDKVTIEVTPDEAYLLDELVVTANGKEVELTDNGDGTYTFTMPSADVRISATFAEDPDWTEPEEPATDVSDIFIDVAPNAWYKDAVQYAYDNGLMTGVSANEFAPDATTTRGMIVSMLARLEGVESANDAGFADVEGEWYATAVNWAASVGVVNGYEDNTFRPNDAITREQLAAILMNYASYKGEDVSARADLSAYTDQPSAWAEETMSWAVAEGLISGVTNTELQPQGQATRAQVAAILQRFLCK